MWVEEARAMRKRTMTLRLVALLVLSSVVSARAQSAASQPASAPAEGGYRLKVAEIRGSVRFAPVGADPAKDEGWTPAKEGDLLGSGIQVRTGARSKLKLVMEPATPPTVIMIPYDSLASIDELFKKYEPAEGEAVVVRLGLARGAIVGGVAESNIRSDLEIRAPVVTLAKRGTWDFRLFVEPGTGRFEISLADRGLVQAINQLTGQTRLVLTGQAVTQAMLRWVETARFNHPVNIQDWYGLRGAELVFNITNQTGLGVLALNGNGGPALDVTRPGATQGLAQTLLESLQRQGQNDFIRSGLIRPGSSRRPEGDFGVGQGVLPVVLDKNSPLVKQGLAQPGRFDVWRADAQQFCKQVLQK